MFTRLLIALLLLSPALAAQDFSQSDTQPAPSAALVQKVNEALAAGNFTTALSLLNTLNAQTPHNAQVLYDLGLTLEALNSPPDADSLTPEQAYRQSIAADASFPDPHVAFGLLLARSGNVTEAHVQLALAIALPDIDPALKARALRALARLDQQSTPPNLAAASDDLLAALKLSPERPEDILLSAEIAEAAAELPAAEQAYRRYLALPEAAGNPQAAAALAHLLLADHHPDQVETLLQPLLTAHPDDPVLNAELAQALLDSDDPSKSAQAAPLLEKLHAAHPADRTLTRLLARVYLQTNHPDQADPLYASLLADPAAPIDPTLLDARAETLLRLHRPAEAEKLLKQAVANPAAFPSHDALADAATHLAFAASEIDDPRTTLQALALRATVQQPSPSSLFLEATANDSLHQSTKAVALYKQFLAAAAGNFPEQESQARSRLSELAHTK